MSTPVLAVRDLRTTFGTQRGTVQAVRGVSFEVYQGETLAIVGESGSGKSATVLSLLGLLPSNASVEGGEALLDGKDLLKASERELNRVRGNSVGMVFQDPLASLNPVLTVGHQIVESIRHHDSSVSRKEARARTAVRFDQVGIPNAKERLDHFPHQFSGGMRQRVMIAMAMANEPKILIGDEPTTALDVTIQAQVLDVLATAQQHTGSATILITHDLAVVAQVADRVLVMYAGKVVEQGSVREVLSAPRHPYTVGLLSSLPRLDAHAGRLKSIPGQPPDMVDPPEGCSFNPRCPHRQGREKCVEEVPRLFGVGGSQEAACHFWTEVSRDSYPEDHPLGVVAPAAKPSNQSESLLSVRGLKVHFPVLSSVLKRQVGAIKAVDGIDLELRRGETLAVVGESGCGKSTMARALVRLIEPTAGQIDYRGQDLAALGRRALRGVRRNIQMVFQDAYSALDDRMSLHDIIAEPLRLHDEYSRERVDELLDIVGLDPSRFGSRYPHEFSGGQRQRIGIARALALHPEILVLDEPVSSLDVSIQAQILNLLADLQRDFGLSYVLIAHDLSVVRQFADRLAVMYLGKIVEVGDSEALYSSPSHPYTQALLSAVPVPDVDKQAARSRLPLGGELPSPANPPSGCNFRTRCFKAEPICADEEPGLDAGRGRTDRPCACFFADPQDLLGNGAGAAPLDRGT